MFLLLCLFGLSVAQTTGSIPFPYPTPSRDYDNYVDMTERMTNGIYPTGTYYGLYYTVNLTQGTVDIGIVADVSSPTGWAAFGISTTGFMIFSDVVAIWVDANGNPFVTPMGIRARVAPNFFTCSTTGAAVCSYNDRGCVNATIIPHGASRNGFYIIGEWTRPLTNSTPCSYPIQVDTPQTFIYSVGQTSNSFSWPYRITFHSARTNITNFPTLTMSSTPQGAEFVHPTSAIGTSSPTKPTRPPVSAVEWAVPLAIIGAIAISLGIVGIVSIFKPPLLGHVE